MKKGWIYLIGAVLVLAIVLFGVFWGHEKVHEVTGVVVDGTMNTIVLDIEGEGEGEGVHYFSTMDTDRTQMDSFLIDDVVWLEYTGALEGPNQVVRLENLTQK